MDKYTFIHFNKIDSTNTYLIENYEKMKEYTVVSADIQEKGKGRMGRKWESDGLNLTFSILLKPNKNNIQICSLLAGLAVSKTLDKYVNTLIKWPNDVILNNKKVCGILAEAKMDTKVLALVIGIGLNVNQTIFEGEIAKKATSLKLVLGEDIDRDKLLREIVLSFDVLYTKYLNDDLSFIEEIRNKNFLKNKNGIINNEEIKIVDIDKDGNLIVLDKNGNLKSIYSGEVTLNSFYL